MLHRAITQQNRRKVNPYQGVSTIHGNLMLRGQEFELRGSPVRDAV
jgi:hypothetical protein